MVSSELVKAHIEWNKSFENRDEEEMDGFLGGVVHGFFHPIDGVVAWAQLKKEGYL